VNAERQWRLGFFKYNGRINLVRNTVNAERQWRHATKSLILLRDFWSGTR